MLWAACFSPREQDGAVACGAAGSCPPGFVCHAGDGRCYRSPPGGGIDAPVIDGAPGDAAGDAGEPDGMPIDADPTAVELRIVIAGRGRVTVEALGVMCEGTQQTPGDCRYAVSPGTEVTLTAVQTQQPSPFTGWAGACSGTDPSCTLTITAPTQVTATFGTSG
jgi:hypothetical protein